MLTFLPADGSEITFIDQSRLQRKVVELYEQDDRALAPSELNDSQTLRLCLHSTLHKTIPPLFEYGVCCPEICENMILIRRSRSAEVFEDLSIVAAIPLRNLKHEGSSIIILIFAHFLWVDLYSDRTRSFQRLNRNHHHIFPHVVNLQDWLGSEWATHLDPINLRALHGCLPELPIIGERSPISYETVHDVLLQDVRKQAPGSTFLTSMPDGVEVKIWITPMKVLEEEALTLGFEISQREQKEPRKLRAITQRFQKRTLSRSNMSQYLRRAGQKFDPQRLSKRPP
jgi:hypothetical protein